jgi:hypothetical protein
MQPAKCFSAGLSGISTPFTDLTEMINIKSLYYEAFNGDSGLDQISRHKRAKGSCQILHHDELTIQ